MTAEEVTEKLNAMDLHYYKHKDIAYGYWIIPNKYEVMVQIVRGQNVGNYQPGICLRITDKYSSLYTIEDGLEEIRNRIQFIMNKHDKERNRAEV